MSKNILIVDDDPLIVKVLKGFLSDTYSLFSADCGKDALRMLSEENIDLMLLDMGLPDIDGIGVLEEMAKSSIDTATLVISGDSDIKTVVKAMQLGAYNYIEKPPHIDEVRTVVWKIFESRELLNEVNYLRSEVERKTSGFKEIIGESKVILDVLDIVDKAAKTDSSVFVTGGSGTGKELVARAIHLKSSRQNKPFVAVSCPNLPTELVESELFGHEKGSFTGASQKKIGQFEMADMGTIFLDEIAELTPSIQARLLRVIQEREFTPVGGTKKIKVDVKIVAATNKNIAEEIKKGNFREDLFFRLNVIPIELPYLKQRIEDIPLLVTHFISRFRKEMNCKTKSFSSKAIEALQLYDWPGNIRELGNVVERVLSLHGESEKIVPANLPIEITKNHNTEKLQCFDLSEVQSLDSFVIKIEKELIIQALQQSNGKLAKAARILKTAPWRLRYKVEKLKINEVMDVTS